MTTAIYARTATADQPTEKQIDELTQYCNEKGLSIFKTYADKGFSGINLNRPALQEMLKDMKSGEIDKVVIFDLARLSRKQEDVSHLINEFAANNIELLMKKG